MQLALISDTHGRHAQLAIPPSADVIVCCGDFTKRGTRDETVAFLDWLASWDKPRLLVGGNHDFFAERRPEEMRELCAAREITWLLDAPIDVRGMRAYGSPWTPRFRDMAWNEDRGAKIRARWEAIPRELDVLITHGPPHGILDRMFLGAHVGCEALRAVALERAPALHAFGHIHEAFGEMNVEGTRTRFLNVATSRLVLGVRAPVLADV